MRFSDGSILLFTFLPSSLLLYSILTIMCCIPRHHVCSFPFILTCHLPSFLPPPFLRFSNGLYLPIYSSSWFSFLSPSIASFVSQMPLIYKSIFHSGFLSLSLNLFLSVTFSPFISWHSFYHSSSMPFYIPLTILNFHIECFRFYYEIRLFGYAIFLAIFTSSERQSI
jgi:hypothetical protein